ncbi:MAG: type II secretion system protein [Phycisphaerae bacterium]|jgi:type II secretory pathway pseudopilin PulG
MGDSAFTLVELLVVMVIMIILIGSVLVATQAVIRKAKTTGTEAVLAVVQDAVSQFAREQKANPTLTQAAQRAGTTKVRYAKRYGSFPPDELELFTDAGLAGSDATGSGGSLAPGGAKLYLDGDALAAPLPPLQFYAYGGEEWKQNALESRDMAAMILAIELYSDTASAILDRIPNDNRHAGILDPQTGHPVMFLDRNGDGKWDSGDLQIRYIIDGWGMAVGYLAQRDWNEDDPPAPSSNHEDWNQAATQLVRLNGGQPVIMSYGPDGGQQFEKEIMEPAGGETGVASLVGDWVGEPNDPRFQIDHPLNADNLYADPALKDKLEAGIPK